MKRVIFLFTTFAIIFSASDYAQNQSSRIEEQHHVNYLKSHLGEIENNILNSFESSNPGGNK